MRLKVHVSQPPRVIARSCMTVPFRPRTQKECDVLRVVCWVATELLNALASA